MKPKYQTYSIKIVDSSEKFTSSISNLIYKNKRVYDELLRLYREFLEENPKERLYFPRFYLQNKLISEFFTPPKDNETHFIQPDEHFRELIPLIAGKLHFVFLSKSFQEKLEKEPDLNPVDLFDKSLGRDGKITYVVSDSVFIDRKTRWASNPHLGRVRLDTVPWRLYTNIDYVTRVSITSKRIKNEFVEHFIVFNLQIPSRKQHRRTRRVY